MTCMMHIYIYTRVHAYKIIQKIVSFARLLIILEINKTTILKKLMTSILLNFFDYSLFILFFGFHFHNSIKI